MKLKRKGYYVAILLGSILSLTACSKEVSRDEETPYYSVTIDGVKNYKTEEDESVSALKERALGYMDLTININYQSQERAFEELDYYNSNFRSEYEEYEYIESGVETIEYYEQVQEVLERDVTEIQFFELGDEERAWVVCDYISIIKHATDEYLEDVGVKLDTKYKRTMTLGFVKENNEWKISEYDITGREEVL